MLVELVLLIVSNLMKKFYLFFLILFLFFTNFSYSNERQYIDTTINNLLSNGYKIIKVYHINKSEYIYHLTNGTDVIVCNTGFTYHYSKCSFEK
jgi:hypothetical protein